MWPLPQRQSSVRPAEQACSRGQLWREGGHWAQQIPLRRQPVNFRVGMPYTVKLLLSSMFIAVYLAFSFFLIALANVILHKRYDF